MRIIFGLVLIVGLGLASFAVYSARQYLGQKQLEVDAAKAVAAQAVPVVNVYVANRDFQYGERITIEDVRLIPYSQADLPDGVFQDEAALFPPEGEKFRTVLRTMQKNEALLLAKVSDPGADAGVSSRLGDNMRAFTIRVDASSGVSGFLHPGDRVDIYWTGDNPNGGGRFTKLIESRVRILATDQNANDDRTSTRVAQTVTVEIDPQQVANLTQAQATGQLTLSLVGADDESVSTALDVDQKTLLGITETVAQPEAAPEECKGVKVKKAGAETGEEAVSCN